MIMLTIAFHCFAATLCQAAFLKIQCTIWRI